MLGVVMLCGGELRVKNV